jgi:hypothetical protein
LREQLAAARQAEPLDLLGQSSERLARDTAEQLQARQPADQRLGEFHRGPKSLSLAPIPDLPPQRLLTMPEMIARIWAAAKGELGQHKVLGLLTDFGSLGPRCSRPSRRGS